MKVRLNNKAIQAQYKAIVYKIIAKYSFGLKKSSQKNRGVSAKDNNEFRKGNSMPTSISNAFDYPKNKALNKISTQNTNNSHVTFTQFLQALSKQNIRLYSKTQMHKLNKIFVIQKQQLVSEQRSQSKLSIQLLMSHLQLICLQETGHQRYYIVRVLDKAVGKFYGISNRQLSKSFVADGLEERHIAEEVCIINLIRVLDKKYGHYTNWFRALGGMTISMSIQKCTFEKNLIKIFQFSQCNQKCTAGLIQLFLGNNKTNSEKNNTVKWQSFIQVIKQNKKSSSRSQKTSKSEASKQTNFDFNYNLKEKRENYTFKSRRIYTIAEDFIRNDSIRLSQQKNRKSYDGYYQSENGLTLRPKSCKLNSRQVISPHRSSVHHRKTQQKYFPSKTTDVKLSQIQQP